VNQLECVWKWLPTFWVVRDKWNRAANISGVTTVSVVGFCNLLGELVGVCMEMVAQTTYPVPTVLSEGLDSGQATQHVVGIKSMV
jgi:hypothetical protein